MLVNGAVVPPRAALEELAGVVGAHRRAVGPGLPPVLVDVAVDDLRLPITGFGNLTTTDAHHLADRVAASVADSAVPTVRFAGGAALEFPGDWSVWAKLDGDVEELTAIAREVMRSVELLGYFVDRRLFRPMLSVATVTESTTGADLERVVGALEAFRGTEWTVDAVVLTTDGFDDGRSATREFLRVPIGG